MPIIESYIMLSVLSSKSVNNNDSQLISVTWKKKTTYGVDRENFKVVWNYCNIILFIINRGLKIS